MKKNTFLNKFVICFLCFILLVVMSFPLYAIEDMAPEDKNYFATYDDWKWFEEYYKAKFKELSHMIDDRDIDGKTMVGARCYQMLKERGLKDPYYPTPSELVREPYLDPNYRVVDEWSSTRETTTP